MRALKPEGIEVGNYISMLTRLEAAKRSTLADSATLHQAANRSDLWLVVPNAAMSATVDTALFNSRWASES